MTTPLKQAQQEWEADTMPHPKNHLCGKENREPCVHEFRQFDQAIALLDWAGDCIWITKFETLQPGQGGASRLIRRLKALADKYQVRLCGYAKNYEPDPPVPKGHLLTKEELEAFYEKHGFQRRKIDADTSEVLYLPPKLASELKPTNLPT